MWIWWGLLLLLLLAVVSSCIESRARFVGRGEGEWRAETFSPVVELLLLRGGWVAAAVEATDFPQAAPLSCTSSEPSGYGVLSPEGMKAALARKAMLRNRYVGDPPKSVGLIDRFNGLSAALREEK